MDDIKAWKEGCLLLRNIFMGELERISNKSCHIKHGYYDNWWNDENCSCNPRRFVIRYREEGEEFYFDMNVNKEMTNLIIKTLIYNACQFDIMKELPLGKSFSMISRVIGKLDMFQGRSSPFEEGGI